MVIVIGYLFWIVGVGVAKVVVASRAVMKKHTMIAAEIYIKLKNDLSLVSEGRLSWLVLLIRRKLLGLDTWCGIARKMEFRSLWTPRRVYYHQLLILVLAHGSKLH